MANRFFANDPRPGQPVSRKGLAAGIHRMAYALDNLTCADGSVVWSDFGAPMIVPGGEGGTEGTLPNLSIITTPVYVLGKDAAGVVGWVATVTHASQHPVS